MLVHFVVSSSAVTFIQQRVLWVTLQNLRGRQRDRNTLLINQDGEAEKRLE